MSTIKGFEILPHVADARLRVFGKNKEELFLNAIKGMAAIIKPAVLDKDFRGEKIVKNVKLKSFDISVLLIDFLSEALALSDINSAVFYGASFKDFSDKEINADIKGFKVKEFDEDIKAVTYHEAEIKINKEGILETIIVFDI